MKALEELAAREAAEAAEAERLAGECPWALILVNRSLVCNDGAAVGLVCSTRA